MVVEVVGWKGVAQHVLRTHAGYAVVVMVGDDTKRRVRVEDCTPLKRWAYCPECGQIGCTTG